MCRSGEPCPSLVGNAVSAFQPQQAFPTAGRDPTAQGGSTSPGRGVDGQHQCLVDQDQESPSASSGLSGHLSGPIAPSLTWLGRICRHDGGWWGGGRPAFSTAAEHKHELLGRPPRGQVHGRGGAGLPEQLTRGSRWFSTMASPAGTAPPRLPRKRAAPVSGIPTGCPRVLLVWTAYST